MKGVRFYLEYPDEKEKNKATRADLGNHDGNVIALFYENYWLDKGSVFYDGLASLFDRPNSPVCGTGISKLYVDQQTKRISEKQAREIHPELFAVLGE